MGDLRLGEAFVGAVLRVSNTAINFLGRPAIVAKIMPVQRLVYTLTHLNRRENIEGRQIIPLSISVAFAAAVGVASDASINGVTGEESDWSDGVRTDCQSKTGLLAHSLREIHFSCTVS